MPTKIEWCDETINPIRDLRKGKGGRGYHCTKCSPGCLHCYAERINKIRGNGKPFDDSPVQFELVEKELEKVAKWKRPRMVFVQSMGDLFHERVVDDQQYRVFDVLNTQECEHHTLLFLTKRPHNLLSFINEHLDFAIPDNFYFGLTVCNQEEADAKLPEFLKIPGKKFLSIEPMLEKIDLTNINGCLATWNNVEQIDAVNPGRIDAVILGGETGAGARPMHPEWARSVVWQCKSAGVSLFIKQLHINGKVNKNINEWPEDLRVRELPWINHN